MKFSLFTFTLSFCLFFSNFPLSALSEYAEAQRALKEGKFFRPGKEDGSWPNFFKSLSIPSEGRPVSLWMKLDGALQLRYIMENGRSGTFQFTPASHRFTIPAVPKKKLAKKTVNIGQYMVKITGMPLASLFIKPNPDMIDAPILAEMDLKKYPHANQELLHLKMVQEKEKLSFYINGSYAGSFREGAMVSLTAFLNPRSGRLLDLSGKEVISPLFHKIDLSSRAKNEIPAKLRLTEKLPVPMYEKISRAIDMRKIRSVADKSGYRNKDLSKTAFDGLDTALIMSVPSYRYSQAYILCAPIPGTDMENMLPKFRLAMTRYARYGRADAAIASAEADLSLGGKNIRKVGTALLTIDGKEKSVPLYLVSLYLPHYKIEDILTRDTWSQLPFRDFLDIDLQGPGARTTKEKKRSSIAVLGITLQKNPLAIALKQSVPGNLFTPEDGIPTVPLEISPLKDGKFLLAWEVKDIDKRTVLHGKKEIVSVKGKKEFLSCRIDPPGRGYFSIDFTLYEKGEKITSLHTSLVKAPQAARKWKAGTSPYSSWYWGNAHNLRPDVHQWGKILNKLGIYAISCARTHTAEDWKKYGITFIQHSNLFHSIYTDKNILSKDPALWKKMEKELIRQLSERVKAFPECKRILLMHESYSGQYGALPQTLLKKAPRKWDAKREELEKARVQAAMIYCRIIRKNFPHLKIIFGNSCWAQEMVESFAARGFDPSLVDYIGTEAVGSWVASPESFSLWNPDGSAYVLRETAKVNGFKNHPVTATFEWSCRSSNPTDNMRDPHESAIRQAQWLMRDVITAHTYGFDSIPLMSVTDTGTAYNNGRTYGALGCMDRQFNPKPLAAAITTATRILDQVKFVKSVKSPTDIFLFGFKRSDGKNVYALWVSKGSAKCRIKVTGKEKKILSEDLYGRESFYPVKNAFIESHADGSLRYFITENTFELLTAADRVFPTMQEPEKLLKKYTLSSGIFTRVTEKDERIDGRAFNDRSFQAAFLVSSAIQDVNDPEKGKCVSVEFDISTLPNDYWYHGGYTMYRFKKPIPVPQGADGIGLWVKANGSLGRLAWEVKDAKGRSFISNGEPRNGANMLNAMYDNEFYSPSWRFMYMALTPLMAQPKSWFTLQWHGKGAVSQIKEITGILLSTSNKMPRVFELKKVENQEIRFQKMVFFSAPGATEAERRKALYTLSPEAARVYGRKAPAEKVNKIPALTGNLIANGNMETLALPSKKQLPGNWKLLGSEFPVSWMMHPLHGKRAAGKVEVRKENNNHSLWFEGTYVCTKVPLKALPGGSYLLQAKIKGSGQFAARFHYRGGASKVVRSRAQKGKWRTISGVLTLPEGKENIFLLIQQGASKGDLQIDDISLQYQK